MKETSKNSDLSYNLYYIKDFGKIEDQLEFLDSLHIHDAQLVLFPDGSEYCNMVLVTMSHNQIKSRLITIRPSFDGNPKRFQYPVVNMYHWLSNKCKLNHTVITFKPLSLCEEDHSDGEEATVPVAD